MLRSIVVDVLCLIESSFKLMVELIPLLQGRVDAQQHRGDCEAACIWHCMHAGIHAAVSHIHTIVPSPVQEGERERLEGSLPVETLSHPQGGMG